MAYSKDISVNGKLDSGKVLLKMNALKQAHIEANRTEKQATQIAFDFGRNLIGFNMAEAWRIGQEPA